MIQHERTLRYLFTGFTGKTIWRYLLPRPRQTRYVAQRLLATLWKGADPENSTLVVQMPWGNYRIVAGDGSVEPFTGELLPIR